mmetsp:Transcript_33423/g.92343  ORF Transcript_33423/g.92343 Transcript_33423/m.92343 type:complete len:204 (+) Transcript_33423:607-1218(+)
MLVTVSAAARGATFVTAFCNWEASCSIPTPCARVYSAMSGSCAGSSAGPEGGVAVEASHPSRIPVSGSSLNMCTVDDEEATAKKRSDRNARQWMSADPAPRRSLYNNCPSDNLKTFTTVPVSDAVAISDPVSLSDIAARPVWCATNTWVRWSSWPTCTFTAPFGRTGQHRIQGSPAGAKAHKPLLLAMVGSVHITSSLLQVYT